MTASLREWYGVHRVLEPPDVLPQQAWRLDAASPLHASEMRCDVEWLNIDAASFRQIVTERGADEAAVAAHILATVRDRGKQHNAVTGSGGMFVGRVAEIGPGFPARGLEPGETIASLVSLTLTPLEIDEILEVDLRRGRLRVRGRAVLFGSAIWTRVPGDLPAPAALALFDVAGAPALVARLAQGARSAVIVGADGKSGLLSCAAAVRAFGSAQRVVGIVPDATSAGARFLAEAGLARVLEADAREAVTVLERLTTVLPERADLVVNCVNVGGTEAASILCARDRGMICFFSMATSVSNAALCAEGLGRDVDLLIGNGYVDGHAEYALETLRAFPRLTEYFTETYGGR